MNDLNQVKIYQGFLDTFCLRVDQIPNRGTELENYGNWPFIKTNYLGQEMSYITHEGYLNFNVNGVTYLTRDCEDVRTYLESLGYKESKGFCILAEWYSVDKMESVHPIDSKEFRLYFGLTFVDHFSPTLFSGNIGKNEEEIKQNIEKAKNEDPVFCDELWLSSDWRKNCLIEKDRIYLSYAVNYLRKCISELGYRNVYVSDIIKNPELITKIINYFKMSQGRDEEYVLSDEYIKDIPNKIQKYEEEMKGKLIGEPNYGIMVNTDKSYTNQFSLFGNPKDLCNSEEELWESLYNLLNEKRKIDGEFLESSNGEKHI